MNFLTTILSGEETKFIIINRVNENENCVCPSRKQGVEKKYWFLISHSELNKRNSTWNATKILKAEKKKKKKKDKRFVADRIPWTWKWYRMGFSFAFIKNTRDQIHTLTKGFSSWKILDSPQTLSFQYLPSLGFFSTHFSTRLSNLVVKFFLLGTLQNHHLKTFSSFWWISKKISISNSAIPFKNMYL